jgi:predicted dehydrogenase
MAQYKVGLIGCGKIGQKRAASLPNSCKLSKVWDIDIDLAESYNVTVDANMEDCDIVIVSTYNAELAPYTLGAVRNGKHVLVEKPAGINAQQLQTIKDAAAISGSRVRVGFNHRYHPAIKEAKHKLDGSVIGKLMHIRGRYGHGGRLGYEKEWRADPLKSGGGQLMDQGVHLIDLCSWFMGPFTSVGGKAVTSFWDMPVDDNAFMMLEAGNVTAWLHTSCTEWRNLFSFEIFGTRGKLEITGLGGSYGVETLKTVLMLDNMGMPQVTTKEYLYADNSWKDEMTMFLWEIENHKEPDPGIDAALTAMHVVEAIYGKNNVA